MMTNTKSFLISIINCSHFIFLVILNNNARAEKAEYINGSDCKLVKFIDNKWQATNDLEFKGQEIDIQEAKKIPGNSNFKIGSTWYSAKTSCFSKVEDFAHLPPPEEETKKVSKPLEREGYIKTSQFQYQTHEKDLEITPSISYSSLSTDYKTTPAYSLNVSGFIFGVMPEYGITENISAGTVIKCNDIKSELTPSLSTVPNTSTKGIDDPMVFINSRFKAGAGLFRATAKISFALSHATVDASGNKNAASGGIKATPQIGYELPAGPGILGIQFEGDLYKGDRTIDDSSSGALVVKKGSGGQFYAGSLFYEFDLYPSILGLSMQYGSTRNTKTTSAGTMTNNKDGFGAIAGLIYGAISISEKVTLLPGLGYGSIKFSDSTTANTVDNCSLWNLIVGARIRI